MKYLTVYASAGKGYFVNYFNNTMFINTPYLTRIENFLPVNLKEQPVKHYDKYSVQYEFVATYPNEIFQFTLWLAENAEAKVFLNDTVIFDVSV